MSQAMVHIHLERVVIAVAAGPPGGAVRYLRIRQGRSGWVEDIAVYERRHRQVGVDRNDFVIASRAYIADGQRQILSELLLNTQRVGFHRWRVCVRLDAARRD